MDDFLHNLRKNTDRNYDKRRQNPQYRGPERRGPREQQHRPPFQKRNDSQEMMTEMVPEVKALLTRIEETQKKMIEMTERNAAAQERHAALGRDVPRTRGADVSAAFLHRQQVAPNLERHGLYPHGTDGAFRSGFHR